VETRRVLDGGEIEPRLVTSPGQHHDGNVARAFVSAQLRR
jgi:hypothetical protein